MQQVFRKIKRVQPVIKARKERVDEEFSRLNVIRVEKAQVVGTMREMQQKYMQGVADLNKIRQSKIREAQTSLEQALDYVKDEWYRLFQKVQEVERRERSQLDVLLGAERELRVTEKLKEKYEVEYRAALSKAEQKQMDEHAIRKFVTEN